MGLYTYGNHLDTFFKWFFDVGGFVVLLVSAQTAYDAVFYWRHIDRFSSRIEKNSFDYDALLGRAFVWKELKKPDKALKDLCSVMNKSCSDNDILAVCGYLMLLESESSRDFAAYDLLVKLPHYSKPIKERVEVLRKVAVEKFYQQAVDPDSHIAKLLQIPNLPGRSSD